MKSGIGLKVEDYISEDNYIYFIASTPRIIGEYNHQLGKMNVLLDFSQQMNVYKPFTKIVKYNYKIYCMPCYAENIYCYNLNSNQFYSLYISDSLFRQMPNRKIIEAIEANGYIYCVCRSPQIVIIIDPKTDKYELCYNNDVPQEHEFFSIEVTSDCIIYPLFHNSIVRFDMMKHIFCIEKLFDAEMSDSGDYIFQIIYDDVGFVWIRNHKGEVYRKKNRESERIELSQHYIKNSKNKNHNIQYMISEMLYREGCIYLILSDVSGYRILKRAISSQQFEWIEIGQHQQSERKEIRFDTCKIVGDIVYIYRVDENMFYMWDFLKGFMNEFDITLPGDIAADLRLGFPDSECVNIDLKFYIDYVQNLKDVGIENKVVKNKDIGKIIYLLN